VEILGPDHDPAVVAWRDGSEGTEVDGCGHDKSARVVGVLADQVDAPWSYKDRGLGPKSLRVLSFNTVYIEHAGPISLRKKDRKTRYLSLR